MKALIALVLFVATAAAADRDAAKKAVEEGDAARAKGDVATAVAAYDRAIEADPGWPTGWHRRGLARRQAGKLDDAVADLRKAIELDPGAPGPHNDLGLARADQGDLAGAIAAYDTAIELGPDAPIPWNNRSFARRLSGDVDGALRDATMALQLDPKYARAYLNRGLCLYDLREWEDALADLEKSVELESEGQDYARLRIWILKARLGKREAADKQLREWVLARKSSDDWPGRLAKSLLGELKESDLSPGSDPKRARVEDAEKFFFLGSKALIEGNPKEARANFEEALRTGVKNTEVIRSAEAELAGMEAPK